MPDPHRLSGELTEILQNKRYNWLLSQAGKGAKEFADEAAWRLFNLNAMTGSVTVEELIGPFDLYRAYDGISYKTARTHGAFWCDRELIKQIWAWSARRPQNQRRASFLDVLRAACFIDPKWNEMKFIARLRIPAGSALPVFKGSGNWRALLQPGIRNPQEVMDRLGMLPIPGPHQYMAPSVSIQADYRKSLKPGDNRDRIPLWAFNESWVCRVPDLEATWPLAP